MEEEEGDRLGQPLDAIGQQWGRALKCKSNVDSLK